MRRNTWTTWSRGGSGVPGGARPALHFALRSCIMNKRTLLSEDDRSLFRQAVADAKPLPHHGKALPKNDAPPPYPVQSQLDEHEALRESLAAEWTAQDWLDSGDEPNFLMPGLSRQVLRKLRSGTWVIQS